MTTTPTARRLVPDPYDSRELIDVTDLPQPIPTDVTRLLEYVTAHRPWWGTLRAALVADGCDRDRANKLVDQVETEVAHADLIDRTRGELRDELRQTEQAIRAVSRTLHNLREEIYDVEYAEGGAEVAAMRDALDAAHRSVIVAAALNPCRQPEPISDRTELLRAATINDTSQTGYIEYRTGHSGVYIQNTDMAALAALVLDGLGEFDRHEGSHQLVKPIIGVRLNAAGYVAAKAAGAEVAF